MHPMMNFTAAPAAVSRVIAGQLPGDHATVQPAPSEAGFIPVVVVQRWRSLSAVATTFAFLRSNKALRAALAAGQSIPLPEMPPAAHNAGIFALLVPHRGNRHCAWLLACLAWRCDTEAEAVQLAGALSGPGCHMEGHEMQVFPLSTFADLPSVACAGSRSPVTSWRAAA